ncbi:MAG: aspartate aminotransferase [Saprospiraceae bacterium]|jgi:aspartate aminotransferase
MSTQQFLSDTVLNLEESATLKMSQMARDLKAKGKDVISLSIGEPDFDTPEFIRDAAKKALDDGFTHYTPVPGLIEFRQAICNKLKRDNDLSYDPSQIVVSNGAKQTIYNICQAMLNPGDEVIIFAPYWVSYEAIVKLAGAVPVILTAGVETDFKVAASDLAAAITAKTKFVLFSSPSNPTGSLYTQSELKAIADVLETEEHVFVVSDEIYEHIVFSGKHYSIAQNANIKERTIVVNGMSKGFAMTGWRLGYMAAPSFLAKACSKIQGQVTSGANAFGQKAAVAALEREPKEITKGMMQIFLKRRDMVIAELQKIEGLKLSVPQGAFYIFPDCSSFFGKTYESKTITDSNDLAEALLIGANVATVAGAAFGAPNCIRISYAASEEVLMEACRRFQAFFSELS